MGSPLFITTPVIAQELVPTLTGAALDPVDDATLLVTASGSTLIESVEWALDEATLGSANMEAGQICIVLYDGSTRYALKYIESDAWTESYWFIGSADLSLALPDGWSIYISHDIQTTAGPTDVDLIFTARGGVVG